LRFISDSQRKAVFAQLGCARSLCNRFAEKPTQARLTSKEVDEWMEYLEKKPVPLKNDFNKVIKERNKKVLESVSELSEDDIGKLAEVANENIKPMLHLSSDATDEDLISDLKKFGKKAIRYGPKSIIEKKEKYWLAMGLLGKDAIDEQIIYYFQRYRDEI